MKEDRLLKSIKGPESIKEMDREETLELCGEIRSCLINHVSNNGGHLASNLGVVELTVALHRVFDSPKDQIIFDVGHQCYTHKLLTGRYSSFESLRKEDGLSGFPSPNESEHDILKTGHSSTAISSAVGLLKALQLKGKKDRHVVAVVGDGAMTGGLAYEGLNNGGRMSGNLIVVLNDNDMSISPNVGSFATHLSKIRSRNLYFKFKDLIANGTQKIPVVGKSLYSFFQKVKQIMKSMVYHGNIFEDMGFLYLGPIDGHNLPVLERVLNRAKELKRPCLVHIKTVKGKGYSFAENMPSDFHGLSSFDIETGEHGKKVKPDFSDIFGSELCRIAEEDSRICAITAAMGTGCGLNEFSKAYPKRFYDVGIAEQHAVTFAGGLARNGMKPVFAVYSSFLQRGYDQVIHDLALQGFTATLCVDRAGIVGEDGETHQGLFDIPMLMPIPNVAIYSPTTYRELRNVLRRRVLEGTGISAIRYPRGYEPDMQLPFEHFEADAEWIGNSKELCVVSYGRQVVSCLMGIRIANKPVSFLKLNRIFPIDREVILQLLSYKRILFVEECYETNGIGAYLGNQLLNANYPGFYKNFGIKNHFLKAGKVDQLLKECGLDGNGIASLILEFGEYQ